MDKVFDIFAYLMGKAAGGGGGGGGDVTVESKSISSNGTYTAPSGKAYSPVTVDVPNSYAAGDEGKVVSNGALVAQTAHAEVTQNGTIDTTLNNSVVVNVSGGDPNENANKLAAGTLEAWNAKGLTYLRRINGIYGLKTAVFPDLSSIEYGTGNNLSMNSALEKVDCGLSWSTLPGNCFNADGNLKTIILRRTTVVSLRAVSCFTNTPFKSGGSGGTIYIPKVLYDHLGDGTGSDYKAASNWSTVEGYGTITWAKIEGSQYENYYADGTPIPTT